MIGLFIMAKDSSGKPICIIHTVVMTLVLMLTGVYHYRLCRIFRPIITYVPVSLGNLEKLETTTHPEPSGGPYSTCSQVGGQFGNHGHRRRPSIRSLSEIFYPYRLQGRGWLTEAIEEEAQQADGSWNQDQDSSRGQDTMKEIPQHGMSSELFEGIEATLENLSMDQREHLVSRAFHHMAVRAARPCIWIPRDRFGVAEDQVRDIRLNYPHILVSSDGCVLNDNGKVVIKRLPPDYDPTTQLRL